VNPGGKVIINAPSGIYQQADSFIREKTNKPDSSSTLTEKAEDCVTLAGLLGFSLSDTNYLKPQFKSSATKGVCTRVITELACEDKDINMT
jgi:hypothetical protein